MNGPQTNFEIPLPMKPSSVRESLILRVNPVKWHFFSCPIYVDIPANENIFCVCARIIAVRQGRIDRSVLVAVRKVKPDAALRQKGRADAENVFVRGYNNGVRCVYISDFLSGNDVT